MSKDYLNKIINGKDKLTGELGKEQEAYREFISGGWKNEEENHTGKIITFLPENFHADKVAESGALIVKMAADSRNSGKYKKETYFYVSEDDTFALKIDETVTAEDSSLTAAVISESESDLSECVLYCPETNKYFLRSQGKDIILTGYKNFDYQRFTFKLMYPKAKIFFLTPKDSDVYTLLSDDASFAVNKYAIEDGNIIAELDNSENIKVVTLKSETCIDFINIQNGKLTIPLILAGSKFELLIY
ncbi:MAG: hypothetical protein WCK13_10695 [Ignavibacteriota bacterium]|nr:hypothetical protein [Ignavibacteriota bacterium]